MVNEQLSTLTPPTPSHNPYIVAWCATPFVLLVIQCNNYNYHDFFVFSSCNVECLILHLGNINKLIIGIVWFCDGVGGVSEKLCYTHSYVPSYISMCGIDIPLAGLRSEEVITKKSSWGFLLLWSSWKRCKTHAHQVSPPCVLQLACLRSEEVVLKSLRLFQTICSRHGNM